MNNFNKLGDKAFIYRLVKRFLKSIVASLIFIFLIFLIQAIIQISISVLLTFILIMACLISFIVTHIEFSNLGYRIDVNSINLREGILSINTTTIPYAKITNASLHQSLFQRMFSVGTIIIDQEDSSSEWQDFDIESANLLVKEISSKSNIQPISK